MMFGSIKRLANSNKGLAALGGAMLGRAAVKGNTFAGLAALGIMGEYFRQKKIDAAEQAARDAAIATGQTDPACLVDPRSPECVAHAEAAAVAAGRARMNRLGLFGRVLIGLFIFMMLNVAIFWVLVALGIVDSAGHMLI